VKARLDPESLPDDRDQDVDRDGDPYLGLHRVLRRAEERLDPQMLLDPFEEELHPPPRPVEFGDGQRGKYEVVGEEDQGLVPFPVDILDAAQLVGIVL